MPVSNHLVNESSPYLLQHAHNPVDWYPWGNEAIEKAVNEDKPILVSIGYAACHWCHVMEHESFENETTAAFMNEHFINIKIDREERPDLDHIYMNACQLLTGSGGWPLNIFLTPQLLPFSGGTYFPPRPAYGKASWLDVLSYMHSVYKNDRDKVEEQAQMLADHILKMEGGFINRIKADSDEKQLFSEEDLELALKNLRPHFDMLDGGFGGAPKFPSSMALLFLTRLHFFKPDKDIELFIHRSLEKMSQGGIFDHAGGGFARYATDKNWMVPHFEKMLYDNALLMTLYAEAAMEFNNKNYSEILKKIAAFIERDLMDESGGFYASWDADSEGVEGKYYTFTSAELKTLFPDEYDFVEVLYSIEENGNWENTNILHRSTSDQQLMTAFHLTESALHDKIKNVHDILLAVRKKRVPPALDNKFILSWNALIVVSFINAFKATGDKHYVEIAEKNLQFICNNFISEKNENELLHIAGSSFSKHPAFIEDYAALIAALFAIHQLNANDDYFHFAIQLTDYAIDQFSDADGMFFFTSKRQADIPLRVKEFNDGATPCGNSMMFQNLQLAYIFTGDKKYETHFMNMMSGIKSSAIQYGSSFGNWLCGMLPFVFPFAEVAVCGENARFIAEEIFRIYHPYILMQWDETGEKKSPLLENRFQKGSDLIYLCRNNSCKTPVSSVQDFKNLLRSF